MKGGEVLGLILVGAVAALALYAFRRARDVKPDDYRARDWIGNRDRTDDEAFPKDDR